ncbi:hypothetical protein [Flavobacterium sp. GT3R68]|uniref:hypothetical protein n=1 Tax=Flavobacterium sp. GT3R68 TaxID=2594437 RepID=UPI000F880A04|nr:hypothetical protein [Flavobacterium sp. GT3R68]RTY89104.1 hypothetical protein EKL32_24080 [Flavobacterium sp. GSN2]TRW90098.1 hypothetical protein FNW07_11610 [Flavobacterium sp. GT3R68]
MEEQYLKDISEIKNMMSKSSQFISLSGFSGIIAGIYALIGAFVAHQLIENHEGTYITWESTTFRLIALTAFLVFLLSVITTGMLTYSKAKKHGEKVWNATSRRLMVNFLIPLVTGGIFALLLLRHEHYELIAPVTLLFYGMACVNASKYTLRDVRYLGLTVIILGLIATEFIGYGIQFWAMGFGVCHILYGTIMYYKYDRK